MSNKTVLESIGSIIRTIFSFKLCRCKSKCCDMDVEIDNRNNSQGFENPENLKPSNDIIPEDKHQKTSSI